ncbi:MAG TPA: hypothetical protein VGP72_09780 [Planctomycetota bacterium]|jgi:hypothetical protein
MYAAPLCWPKVTRGGAIVSANALLILCYVFLGTMLPALVLYGIPRPTWDEAAVLSLAVVQYSAFRISLLLSRGQDALLQYTFWMFVYIFLGMAPAAHALTGRYAWRQEHTSAEILFSLLLVIIGVAAYDAGRIVYSKLQSRTQDFPARRVIAPRNVQVLCAAAIVVASIGVFKAGGPAAVMITRDELAFMMESEAGSKAGLLIWTMMMRVPPFVALVLGAYILRHREQFSLSRMDTGILCLLVAALVPVNLVANFPPALPRYWLGTIVLAFVFIFVQRSRSVLISFFVSFAVLMAVIFPYTDLFRFSREGRGIEIQPAYEQMVLKGDYDAFQQTMNAAWYVDIKGVDYGKQMAGAALFWMPRSVWPDKPAGTGAMIGRELGQHFLNFSEPLWAEAYIAGGAIGIMLVFFLYGYGTAFLERALYCTRSHKVLFTNVLVPVLAAFQMFLLRGDLMNGVAYSTPVVLYMLAATRRFAR